MPRNWMVFLLRRKERRSAILWSQKHYTKWPTLIVIFVKYLFNHMHFITNGFKRFSKTNLSNPRQRVPLSSLIKLNPINISESCESFETQFNMHFKWTVFIWTNAKRIRKYVFICLRGYWVHAMAFHQIKVNIWKYCFCFCFKTLHSEVLFFIDIKYKKTTRLPDLTSDKFTVQTPKSLSSGLWSSVKFNPYHKYHYYYLFVNLIYACLACVQ